MRFSIRDLLAATVIVALSVVVVRQYSHIGVMEERVLAYRAAYLRQGDKLNKYMKWYWDIKFDNPRELGR
jgi:hypothetical protein